MRKIAIILAAAVMVCALAYVADTTADDASRDFAILRKKRSA